MHLIQVLLNFHINVCNFISGEPFQRKFYHAGRHTNTKVQRIFTLSKKISRKKKKPGACLLVSIDIDCNHTATKELCHL